MRLTRALYAFPFPSPPSLICKHLKRVIISIEGGSQLLTDLSAYREYVTQTFRSAELTAEFGYLKLLGSLFTIESPKVLADSARDVQRYGGTFRAEDIYEVCLCVCCFELDRPSERFLYPFLP